MSKEYNDRWTKPLRAEYRYTPEERLLLQIFGSEELRKELFDEAAQ